MFRKTALFFSVIFHPLLMPIIGLCILLFAGSFISFIPAEVKKVVFLLFAVGTFVLPLMMSILFWFRGVVSNMHMDEKSERLFPFAVTFIFYLFTYLLLKRIPVYHFLHSFMLGSLISLFTLLVLNFRWKISAHTAGMGGITALVILLSYKIQINLLPVLILAVLTSGIICTSRLILKAHTPAEVYAGFIIGAGIMTGVLIT